MAGMESTGLSLNINFYMNDFYRYNRKAIKFSDRSEYTDTELSYEDTRALKRALSELSSFEYEQGENGPNLVSTIKAFAETYNNTISSTASDYETGRLNKKLQTLTDKYRNELEDIGITIKEDGKLSISDNILKGSTFSEIGKVFSKDTGYVSDMNKLTRRMNREAYEDVYSAMTGCGGRLNILL